MKRRKTTSTASASPFPTLPEGIPPGFLLQSLGLTTGSLTLREDLLARLVNATGGPQVRPSAGRGYGLFAERDYNTEDSEDYIVVAIYNGVRYLRDPRGIIPPARDKYLLKFTTAPGDTRDYHVDGTTGFGLMEKGRWINHKSAEDGDGPNAAWRLRRGTEQLDLEDIVIEVYLVDNVRKGEEFFIDYGPEYDENEWKDLWFELQQNAGQEAARDK